MFSEISAQAQENFSGARVIRAYVQEEAEIAAFETSNREYISPQFEAGSLDGYVVANARNHARSRHCAGVVAGRKRGIAGSHQGRRFCRVQHFTWCS